MNWVCGPVSEGYPEQPCGSSLYFDYGSETYGIFRLFSYDYEEVYERKGGGGGGSDVTSSWVNGQIAAHNTNASAHSTLFNAKQNLINNNNKLDYSLLSSTPAINNPTIVIKQGDTVKGSFTLNQNASAVIELDEGGGGGGGGGTPTINFASDFYTALVGDYVLQEGNADDTTGIWYNSSKSRYLFYYMSNWCIYTTTDPGDPTDANWHCSSMEGATITNPTTWNGVTTSSATLTYSGDGAASQSSSSSGGDASTWNGFTLSIVPTLPENPDPNTIYFLTGYIYQE